MDLFQPRIKVCHGFGGEAHGDSVNDADDCARKNLHPSELPLPIRGIPLSVVQILTSIRPLSCHRLQVV